MCLESEGSVTDETTNETDVTEAPVKGVQPEHAHRSPG